MVHTYVLSGTSGTFGYVISSCNGSAIRMYLNISAQKVAHQVLLIQHMYSTAIHFPEQWYLYMFHLCEYLYYFLLCCTLWIVCYASLMVLKYWVGFNNLHTYNIIHNYVASLLMLRIARTVAGQLSGVTMAAGHKVAVLHLEELLEWQGALLTVCKCLLLTLSSYMFTMVHTHR